MTQQEWKQARQQRDKLLEHYNKTIKPTLLEFYNLTGEDFNIHVDTDKHNVKMSIIYYNGNDIEYETRTYTLEADTGIVRPPNVIRLYSYLGTEEHIKPFNIKVIKVFNQHWDKIKEYMDTRISLCIKDNSD